MIEKSWNFHNVKHALLRKVSWIFKISIHHIIIFYFQNRTQTVEAARADGEKIRLIGAAEARATEAVGRFSHPLSRLLKLQLKTFLRAEAERMRMKASAYKQYGDAAILSLVLEALPQIAAEVGQT